ncbi:hypothetical protein Taro_049277 [Colocasia esculenta]|uniref:Uncharacterized protein n=1 Tax=Colocasia esculenta TaxID=4460 RepID=A0A843XAH7_COLES|nr:hypothetical protein [Colocasia esculenta]
MVGTSEPGIGPTRSKFTQTEATSSDEDIHLAWRLAVGPLACFFYEFEHLVDGRIGGDIRAWDRANQVQVYPDGGDEQRRRHPFGLATFRRATSMFLL